MNTKRYFLISALILILLGSTSIIARSAHSENQITAVDIPAQELNLESVGYSIDDVFDIDAARVFSAFFFRSCGNYSGDDVYDPAAPRGFDTSLLKDNGNYSGDDAYDPAAGR